MDLLLFGLENIGRSEDVSRFIHTDTYVFLLENGKLFGKHVDHEGDFTRIAPDQKFVALTFDNISPNIFSVSDGSCLHFYDYKARKLASYTFNVNFIACGWNTQHDILAVITKEGMVKTYNFMDEGVYLGELGENYLSNTNPFNGILPLSEPKYQDNSIYEKLLNMDVKDGLIDSSATTISWRNTGTLFAVNFYLPVKQKRTFKIFSKDCKYLVEGQSFYGLQSVMCWKPGSSFYLNIPIGHRNKMYVGCFEKNGSLNDCFELYKAYCVEQMEWTNDGEIFAVLQREEKQTPISLYFYKSRKWILKQYLNFGDVHFTRAFQWLQMQDEIFYSLVVLTAKNLYKYVFKKDYITGPGGNNEYNIGALISFTGKHLELTAFLENVATLQKGGSLQKSFPNPINNVIFHPTQQKFIVIDCKSVLYLCNFTLEDVVIAKRYQWTDHDNLPFKLHHIYFENEHTLCCIAVNIDNRKADKLYKGDLSYKVKDDIYFLPIKDVPPNLTFVGNIFNSTVTIEQNYNKITVRGDENTKLLEFKNAVPLKTAGFEIDGKIFIFTISSNQDLYINLTKVLNSVTSFHILGDYLVFSRLQGMLHCVKITMGTLHKFSLGNLHLDQSFSIITEVNSIILTGIPNSTEVVVFSQNNKYENYKLTPLIIDKINTLLDNKQWLEAYDLIEDEELEVDLLIDLNFNRFVNETQHALKSFGNYTHKLNEVIENLLEYDVIQTNYRFLNYEENNSYTTNGKVDSICEHLIKHLVAFKNYQRYLLCIITCLVRAFPNFAVKESIYYIGKLFQEQPNSFLIIIEALQYLSGKTTLAEVFQEVLLTFDSSFIELAVRTFDLRAAALHKLINDLKNLEQCEARLEIRKFVSGGLFKESCRFGKDYNKLSSSSFDISSKQIGIFPENRSLQEINRAKLLESKSCMSEACKIYEKYLGHLESTCSLLANKKSFLGAVRVARKQRNEDLIEREVLPAAEKYCGDLYVQLKTKMSTFADQILNLINIRESLLKQSSETNQILEKNNAGDSINTEEYKEVMQNLFELIEDAFKIKNDVRQICQVLLSNPNKYFQQCKRLHGILYDFHVNIIDSLQIIWPTASNITEVDSLTETCQYLNPPDNVSLKWVMPYFN